MKGKKYRCTDVLEQLNIWDNQDVARGGTAAMPPPPQSILDKDKDLGNYDEHLPLRDYFLAGLLISGLTKEKYNTTLLFALARVVMAQPQWPANGHASL